MSEIDVSNCCYYNDDNAPFCCELYDNECEAQNCYFQQLQQLKEHCKQIEETNKILYQEKCDLIKENEELKKRLDYCFEENSSNYDKFCDICIAKDTCNGNCCYNQIKEMFGYEI